MRNDTRAEEWAKREPKKAAQHPGYDSTELDGLPTMPHQWVGWYVVVVRPTYPEGPKYGDNGGPIAGTVQHVSMTADGTPVTVTLYRSDKQVVIPWHQVIEIRPHAADDPTGYPGPQPATPRIM